MINPTDPVFPIKLTALSGFPAINNPHPTTANIPPGISGHHIKFFVKAREETVISPHPKAKPTNIIPVCSNGFIELVLSQAKYTPGGIPNNKAPGITKQNNFQYIPAISRHIPILNPTKRTKFKKFKFSIKNGIPIESNTIKGKISQI